jgi:hypothetical protein
MITSGAGPECAGSDPTDSMSLAGGIGRMVEWVDR